MSGEAEADEVHGEDGDEEQEGADPFADEQVSGAGNEPACEEDEGGEHGLFAGKRLSDLLLLRG